MKACAILGAVLGVVLPLVAAQDPGQDITCSKTKDCAVGCCGKNNICGMGPDYCGAANCINNCDRKSECDPAGWGPTYAASEACPLNVCCSQFGFCGTTAEFCGDQVVSNPSCSGTSATQKVIGYYEGWGITRPCGAIYPEDLNVGAYTHLNFAFGLIDPNTFEIVPMQDSDKDLYTRLTALKTFNPGLEVWISVGGWSANDPGPTQTTFSDLAGSEANQQKFFTSLISFMTTYGFDGVDIDWEYPGADDRGGKPSDYENYPILLSNMRSAFASAGHNWGITCTFPSSFWYLQHFDVVAIEGAVDWINMMTYDIHGTWDALNVWEGPYVKAHTNLTEIDEALKLLWRNNIDPGKVVFGLGFYGRSFKLKDPSCTAPGCEFTAGGDAGPCTQSVGTLSYVEIMAILATGIKPTLDQPSATQIMVWDTDNWISYDDAVTFKMKMDYANSICLGGVMIWASSLDDKNGSAATALSDSTGLLSRFTEGWTIAPAGDGLGSCTWTMCGFPCPIGMTAAEGNWPDTPLGCTTPPGSSGIQMRTFCCPVDDVPECAWRGASTDGSLICNGACEQGEVPVGSSYAWLGLGEDFCRNGGQMSLCCLGGRSLDIWDKCTWAGTPPLCAPSGMPAACPADHPNYITSTVRADAGAQVCTSGLRSLCCEDPVPVRNCQWYGNTRPDWQFGPQTCSPGCPANNVMLAIDNMNPGCGMGYGSLCCEPVPGADDDDPQVQAFASLISDWITNAQCDAPSTTAKRSAFSFFERPVTRVPVLFRRQSSSPGPVLDSYMATMLYPLLVVYWPSPAQQAMLAVWEQTVALAGFAYSGLTAANLRIYLAQQNSDPWDGSGDPVDPLSDLFCCIEDCFEDFEDQVTMPDSAVCIIPADVDLDTGEGGDEGGDEGEGEDEQGRPIDKRTFFVNWGTDPTQAPTTSPRGEAKVGVLINQILQNNLRPVFYDIFNYGAGAQQPFVELEVVFFLGPNPVAGVPAQPDPYLTNNNPNQAFATFHFHFIRQHTLNLGIGIVNVNVRHGSQIRRSRGAGPSTAGNVDGNWQVIAEPARTVIFDCETDSIQNSRAYYIRNNAQGTTLRDRRGPRGRLLYDFFNYINTQISPDIFAPNTDAWLERRNGVPTPGSYVIDSQGNWRREPAVPGGLNPPPYMPFTGALTPGAQIQPYEPRTRDGDLIAANLIQNS